MAFEAGYGSVRERPLTAREFNYWWVALDRYHQLEAGDEGKKRLAENVRIHQALEEEEARLGDALAFSSSQSSSSFTQPIPHATRSTPARQRPVYDPADDQRNASLFTHPAALLAILPPDDPRAIYVRRGGRLDAHGNPLTRGTPHSAALTQTVIVTDPATGVETRHEFKREPIAPPAPRTPPSAAPPAPSAPVEPPAPAPSARRTLLDLASDLPDLPSL